MGWVKGVTKGKPLYVRDAKSVLRRIRMSVHETHECEEDDGDEPVMTTRGLVEKTVSIQSTNRATIPKDVREVLGVSSGDDVSFIIHGDGSVEVAPTR